MGMRGGKLASFGLIVVLMAVSAMAAVFSRRVGQHATPFVVLVSLGIALATALVRLFWRPTPWALAGLVALGYAGTMAWLGIHTAQCPHCDAGDGDRIYYLQLDAWFFGFAAAWVLLCIGTGTIIASWLRARRE